MSQPWTSPRCGQCYLLIRVPSQYCLAVVKVFRGLFTEAELIQVLHSQAELEDLINTRLGLCALQGDRIHSRGNYACKEFTPSSSPNSSLSSRPRSGSSA